MDEHQQEARSSVKITRNAKGEAQFEVKAYTGEPLSVIEEARENAIHIYRELEREFS